MGDSRSILSRNKVRLGGCWYPDAMMDFHRLKEAAPCLARIEVVDAIQTLLARYHLFLTGSVNVDP